MIMDRQSDISTLILRAFSLAKRSSIMAFVGIYSSETFEALALTDREHVQIKSGLMPQKNAVEIQPSQVQAIVRHIRTPEYPLTQIKIANLRFVCLRNGSGCMTGMSNFNIDSTADSKYRIDKTVYNIIHKHYTSQDLLDGHHALNISAILKEEFIIIGMCKAGEEYSLKIKAEEESSLKILKAILEDPTNADDEISVNRASEKESRSTESTLFDEEEKSFNFSFSSSFENGNETSNLLVESEVELRESALSPEERKKLRQKRETSFCEDWRKATIKSIDALKLIGPFKSDDEFTDNRPLIDNMESIGFDQDVKVSSESESDSDDMETEHGSERKKGHRVIRRPSRATMV
jgi:hypothetical protein